VKYLADTIIDYVWRATEGKEGTFRFVLPAYPSDVLVRIGEVLTERAKKTLNHNVKLSYGVAFHLGKEWQNSALQREREHSELIRQRGWYNASDNLTSLRNQIRDEATTDCLIILLAGYEFIHDKESLRDFFRLDQANIWNICLGKSFVPWIEQALIEYLNPDDNTSEFEDISDFICSIYDLGLSDLITISSFLERLDFKTVMCSKDAYCIILENLDDFGLPNLTGVLHRKARNKVRKYIINAHHFFNYSMFLEAKDRTKALNTIKKYRKKVADDGQDESLHAVNLSSFRSINELLDAIEEYIANGTESLVPNLKAVDFTFILDKVLGFKGGIISPIKTTSTTLRGKVPEIFLNALWDSLEKLKRDGTLAIKELKRVSIVGQSFRHDFDSIVDDGEAVEPSAKAREFLTVLLGGVDEFLSQRVFSFLGDNESCFVEVSSLLLPEDNENSFIYQRSMRAEPQFRFKVVLETEDGVERSQDYNWPLPANHHSRLLVSLYEWINRQFASSESVLPAFSAPFVAELFMAKDEEEAARLLELCIGNKNSVMLDLLSVAKGLGREERTLAVTLSVAYQEFVKCCLRQGFYVALEQHYPELRRAYRDLLNGYLSRSRESVLGPLLFKAFLLLPEGDAQQGSLWNDYLTGAVVTPLHPAMIDMMYHQSIYLCRVFSTTARRALKAASAKAFAARHFDRIVDLSNIQWPLYGILCDTQKNLDTNIKSLGYVHMLGNPTEDVSKIATKTLLEEYVAEEDDSIDDRGLFRETRNSQLIYQTLRDYRKLYPFAEDGISIGAYCGSEIQPLIAGIDKYVEYASAQQEQAYSVQLTIFSDGVDDSSVLRWINAWKDRWQVAELSSGMRHYEHCQISIKYRVVARDDGFEQFRRILNQAEYDVFYFMDFIKSTTSRFQVLEPLTIPDDYQKFPIVEKVSSRMVGGGKESQRERVVSNPRFQLNALHAEVMASLKQPSLREHKHIIVSSNDFSPMADTVDAAHKCSGWVVCIDPSIDESLLRKSSRGTYDREVIAFGTGVGAHGEKNFTISTDQFSMYDIENGVSAMISGELGLTDEGNAQAIASALVREAAKVAGLSVVKATGGEKFVRELIANALTRKVAIKDPDAFCDELVSLDAFLHWFDEPMSERRPDLLRIRASIVNGYFEITLQLIECKLAGKSEGYLEKAREQIESGLRELVGKFKPRNSLEPDDYGRSDQRYWWMQLHRLVSTHGSTTKAKYGETLAALERLGEGLFAVDWQAGIFAIWTDQHTDELSRDTSWQCQNEHGVFPIVVATTGMGFLKKASLLGTDEHFFVNIPPVRFGRPEAIDEDTASPVALMAEKAQTTEYKSSKEQESHASQDNTCSQKELGKSTIQIVDDTSHEDNPYGFERVYLGAGTRGGRDAYWEFGHPDLPNRHILVFGASGTGKTYLIQALMCELARLGRNTLVVDYTSGFTNSQLEEIVMTRLKPTQHLIKVKPLEVNPFRKQINYIDDMPIEEDPATIAGRVSGVFDEVYQLGDQQRSALYNAIRNGVVAKGEHFDLNDMIDELEGIRAEGGPSASAAASVISKIQPFVDTNPFGRERHGSWERLFKDPESRVHIIQLAGFMKNASRLITEFSLIDLYWYYRSHGNQWNPKIIVLDEIQNLNHKLESPIGQFLTEGRKFGISLILATQTLSNLEKDERDRLFQASHKIFFRPADTEIKAFAQILADSTGLKVEDWVEKLSTLKRGECYSLGYAYNEHTDSLEVNTHFRIRVKPLEERY